MDIKENKNIAWNEPFFKKRDLSQCFSIGVSFLSNRFFKIIGLALPVMITTAAALTYGFYLIFNLSLDEKADAHWLVYLAPICGVLALSLITSFVYRCILVRVESLNMYSIGLKYVYNKVFWRNTLKSFVVYALVAIVAAAVCIAGWTMAGFFRNDQENGVNVAALILKVLAVFVVIMLAIPSNCIINMALIENKPLFASIKKGYVMGWNNWGVVFSLELIVAVCIAIIALLVMTPTFVIAEMQHSAILSMRDGDPVIIPDYLMTVMVFALFLSSCFCVFLAMLRLLPQAYLYASITTQEQ